MLKTMLIPRITGFTAGLGYLCPMLNTFFIALLLLLSPQYAAAIGFEQAKLHSHMGERLDVRIPLLLAEDEVMTQYQVSLASPAEYARMEQLLPQAYLAIRLDMDVQEKQQPVAVISSSKAIDEGLLTLLIKIKRGRGSFFKKVQLFLEASPYAQVKSNKVWRKTAATRLAFTAPQAELKSPEVVSPSPVPSNIDWARRDRYGPVQAGDSLSVIAYRLRKDKRWSNQDIVSALYQKNPDAFHQGDVNQLKKGSFLTVPNGQEVKAILAASPVLPVVTAKPKRPKAAAVKPVAATAVKKRQKPLAYYGKISLGLTEQSPAPQQDAMLQQRLKRLEPLFQRSINTALKMDGLQEQFGDLASDMKQLNQKMDKLSQISLENSKQERGSGWLGFFVLLVLNVLGLIAYFYRRQMKAWQLQLLEAQRASAHPLHGDDQNHEDTPKAAAAPVAETHAKMDVVADKKLPDNQRMLDALPKSNAMPQDEPSVELLWEHTVDRPTDHAMLFEESVHKKDWQTASLHYNQMGADDCNRIRTQALLVEKMHGESDVLGRNVMLMTLFKQYSKDDWHVFCSFFSGEVWQSLQDEKIISFTGEVIEEEVKRMEDTLTQSLTDLIPQPAVQPETGTAVIGDSEVLDFSHLVMGDVSTDDYQQLGDVELASLLPDDGDVAGAETVVNMSSYPSPSATHDGNFELDFSGLDIASFEEQPVESEEEVKLSKK